MTGKSIFEKLFSFSRSELRGLIVLFILMFVFLVLRYLRVPDETDFELKYEVLINDSLEISPIVPERIKEPYSKNENHSSVININTCSYNDLIGIGFPDKVAGTIIAYRKKAGQFSNKKDLLKVYGVDTSFVNKLGNRLVYNEAHVIKNQKSYFLSRLDLNQADSNELQQLPGIGTRLSARIVRYRNALGGFYSTKQLKEVYGISDSLFQLISPSLIIDSGSVHRINLNNAGREELQKHPYLNHYLAGAILNYRKLAGPITNPEELITNHLLPEENYEKIRPYLVVKGD